ncbi:GGDEF domain-containing protein [Celeribacter sp.]|uniref:GGDEF domain-containing protein n=1 Tax=Celeribacter sp. TaxID=1890673 RepID=UPI003A8E277B
MIEHTEDRWLNIIMVVDITEVSLARQKLEHLVAHDELTGLLSRRGFNTQHADGKRQRDYDLFLIDVDHFKSVNDAYGHEIGDALLRKIAKVLQEKAKPLGCASRIGGEECALMRPVTRHEPNQHFAEDLMRDIAATVLHTPSGPVSRTISVGLTRLNRSDRLETAVKWADWAQRAAKENGRNTVVVTNERFSENLRLQGKLTSHQDIVQALEKKRD